MTSFFLIRHGETNWSLNDKYNLKGGHRDFPSLTTIGINQAEEVSSDPRLKKAELILSSPYTRAMQTAAIISKNTGLNILVEYDLREWQPDLNLGVNDLIQLEDIIEDYNSNYGEYPIGVTRSWESKTSLKNRAKNVLNKYIKYDYVVVVTHEQLIKTWIDLDKIDFCRIYELSLS